LQRHSTIFGKNRRCSSGPDDPDLFRAGFSDRSAVFQVNAVIVLTYVGIAHCICDSQQSLLREHTLRNATRDQGARSVLHSVCRSGESGRAQSQGVQQIEIQVRACALSLSCDFILRCRRQPGLLSHLQYKDGEPVRLWVNKVGPYDNPQETYNYYYLPFCAPKEAGKPKHKWGGLGEVLQGNELIDSQLEVKFKSELHSRSHWHVFACMGAAIL